MGDQEYEYDYVEHMQLLELRKKYTEQWCKAFCRRDWKTMEFYDQVLEVVERELETL